MSFNIKLDTNSSVMVDAVSAQVKPLLLPQVVVCFIKSGILRRQRRLICSSSGVYCRIQDSSVCEAVKHVSHWRFLFENSLLLLTFGFSLSRQSSWSSPSVFELAQMTTICSAQLNVGQYVPKFLVFLISASTILSITAVSSAFLATAARNCSWTAPADVILRMSQHVSRLLTELELFVFALPLHIYMYPRAVNALEHTCFKGIVHGSSFLILCSSMASDGHSITIRRPVILHASAIHRQPISFSSTF